MSGAIINNTAGAGPSLRIGQLSLGTAEATILALALAAILLSAYHLWRIARQEDRRPRLQELLRAAPDRSDPGQAPRPRWYERLGSGVAASRIVGFTEQQRLLDALAKAGIKQQGSLARFVAGKVGGAATLAAVAWLFFEWEQWLAGIAALRVALLFVAAMCGWRLPDIVLSRLTARRQRHLEEGLPDALDLLVISAEAGLSLDQAVEQVSQTLHASNPVVAEEFATTASEMQVLANRSEALDNLVRRTGLASLRSITATLSQTLRFGTPLADSMRVLAAEMRMMRLARLEERAARLPVLLTIPLVLFILPCLFMVIGTPVALRIIDALKDTFGNHF
jgi:tight adherence protein C